MSSYLQSVQSMHSKYEEDKLETVDTNDNDPNARAMIQSKKAFAKELKKVVEASDVIIEVLDAREPEGCRSEDLEQDVLA